jgi:hypothetical protein
LVCDEVFVDPSGSVDLPNVVVDDNDASVRILGSGMWGDVKSLASIFVGIISHESIHLTLLRIDGSSSDYLDNVASLSVISGSLKDIPLVKKYFHGMIGFNL